MLIHSEGPPYGNAWQAVSSELGQTLLGGERWLTEFAWSGPAEEKGDVGEDSFDEVSDEQVEAGQPSGNYPHRPLHSIRAAWHAQSYEEEEERDPDLIREYPSVHVNPHAESSVQAATECGGYMQRSPVSII